MATIRPVERITQSYDEPVTNEYTDLVLELKRLEDNRADGEKRQEALVEQNEVPEGTTTGAVRKAILLTARTNGDIGINFKSGKNQWPIVFGVSRPREAKPETAPETAPAKPTAVRAA